MEKFYLGLDIGTDSVGIACTDENYKLLRACRKDCWAVRLFDASKTAAERRMARTARRRLARRKQRIGFLQALFAPFIDDKNFFIRLNNSQFLVEDKDEQLCYDTNTLFADINYTDKDFHKRPTIYHWRKALMTENITDLRLYYLALHHIIKYRGHFLFEGSMADIRDMSKLVSNLNAICSDLFNENVPFFNISLCEQARHILMSSDKKKNEQLVDLFGLQDKRAKEIIKGICGYSVRPSALLSEQYKEEASFSFKDLTDETFEAMQAVYSDDFQLFVAMRAIYNYITFEKILAAEPDISSAMITIYEKHKSDLKKLKTFLRNNVLQEEYNRFFKSTKEKNNYVNYIGYTKKGGEKKKVAKCTTSEFLDYTKKYILSLNIVNDEKTRDEILGEIEQGSFLPKILHADNGLFPRQINEDELKKIVLNMTRNCPQTSYIADKILPIFLFKIPYYVGPLTGKNSWVVRSGEKITPWNISEVVYYAQSNEAFMRRMTNKCSYLHSEDVLPKASIYYQKYNVLNQINKLKINDRPISLPIKQKIFNELFMTRKKVTDNAIKDIMVRDGIISESEKSKISITGKDGELTATMSSYLQLKSILGEFVDNDILYGGTVCENIILWHTLNTDKNIVVDLIRKNYGHIPQIINNIKALKGLVFKDFGRLSKKLLTGLQALDVQTGQMMTILDLLYETNQNLNEILSDKSYNFEALIKAENAADEGKVDYSEVEKLYVSPAVRRGIWQAIRMTDEYVSKIGKAPDKIFIEFTRADGKKKNDGRTVSRQKQLLEKYRGVEGIKDIIAELKAKNDLQLRQERLYLYFRQLGKCMYSGEPIDLELLNTNQYDVDHILPRTYIKDDSLDNKVLVLRAKNAKKADQYPIPFALVTDEARRHWEVLKANKLISDLTYNRLTRTEPLNDDDFNDFINRQKIITDQTVKAVAELLSRKYPSTKIVYSRAKNVSEFRQKFDLFKCRDTNDLHHARDAYLNVVVGNVFDTCFSTPFGAYYKDGEKWRNYNLKTMFARDVRGAWVHENFTSIEIVKRTYQKTSMSVTRFAYCNKGGFYKKMTILPKGNPNLPPLKGSGPLSDSAKYGGREAINNSYFIIVENIGKGGKKDKYILSIPVLVAQQEKTTLGAIDDYIKKSYGLTDYKIIVRQLKQDSLVKINGYPLWIVGGGGVKDSRLLFHNALQWFSDNLTDKYIKILTKLFEYKQAGLTDEDEEEYVISQNRFQQVTSVINKENNLKLYDLIVTQLRKSIYKNTYSVFNSYESLLEILIDKKGTFINMKTYTQAAFLLNIVNFLKANSSSVDLSIVGGSKTACLLRRSNKITEMDFRIVYQSPCGLIERENKI